MTIYVKPNRSTPDPERGGYLIDAGRAVDESPYWLRRIADGDVSEADPPVDPPGPPPAPPAPTPSPLPAGSSVSEPRNTRKGGTTQ